MCTYSARYLRNRAAALFIITIILLLLLSLVYVRQLRVPDDLKQSSILETRQELVVGLDGRRETKEQFRYINRVVTEFDGPAAESVKRLVERKAPARDLDLIALVRHLLDPPPTYGTITLARDVLDTLQSKEVDDILQKKKNGFFVECGGLDGERASNSLPLETKSQWTGILIEANPFYYTQLLGKNRNVWSLNACLSPFDHVAQLHFESRKGHMGRVVMKDDHPAVAKNNDFVPCFPLETILLALNRTHVDYLSLDIEGLELDVLKTIPYDRIDVSVMSVEYIHGVDGKDSYKSFMESKGFRTHKDLKYFEPRAALFAEDYIFVKDRK